MDDDPNQEGQEPALRRPEDRRGVMDRSPPAANPPPPPPAARTAVVRRREADPQRVMSLGDHLEELRKRVMYALIGVAVLFFAGLYFGPTILHWLIIPVQQALRDGNLPPTLLATGMFETFFTYLKISTISAVVLGFPWILWQAWRFVAPGLYRHEQRFVTMLLPMSVVLSVLSGLFLYLVVLPLMLHFFVHFGNTVSPELAPTAPLPAGVSPLNIPVLGADPPAPKAGDSWINSDLKELRVVLPTATGTTIYSTPLSTSSGIILQPRVGEWIDTLLGIALAFAAGFQLPVVILLLGWVGIVTPAFLAKYRKHALFVIAIIAALLTPPDPTSMCILIAPLYLLFEFGILMLRFFPASKVGRRREEDGEPAEG